MVLTAHRWLLFSLLLIIGTLAGAVFGQPGSYTLLVLGDVPFFLVVVLVTALFAQNARHSRGEQRMFWGLFAFGSLLWATNAASWVYFEVILRQQVPQIDPFDILLFLHVVPFMAAVALRPHRLADVHARRLLGIDLVLLLLFWIYLYTAIVLTNEYIERDVKAFTGRFDQLYAMEISLVVVMLALLAWGARQGWRKIYTHLLLASGLYLVVSTGTNLAIASEQYHSGDLYDVFLTISLCWFGWIALRARDLHLQLEVLPPRRNRPDVVASRLATLAMLAVPVIGTWTLYLDPSHPQLRIFRLGLTLLTILAMGLLVFIRQFLQERWMVRLLRDSEANVQSLQSLQHQLVQKEKLASLGQLVAGAAHEINNPLAAILGYAELLQDREDLGAEARAWAYKIRQQAIRTSDLVTRLLRFARQSPAEKAPVDVGELLKEIVPFFELQAGLHQERLLLQIPLGLPLVQGSASQLQQAMISIVQNAFDAMGDSCGKLHILASAEVGQVRLEFCDEGPGMDEPERVFDPFYTTKPVGKGTGLGLSAAYGVIQEHGGQITAINAEAGGAVITIMLPMADGAAVE